MTLQEYLSQRKMTAQTLATAMGVAVTTITRLLSKERDPSMRLMRQIHAATGGEVTPNDFAGINKRRRQQHLDAAE